jgi:hypothetical protein
MSPGQIWQSYERSRVVSADPATMRSETQGKPVIENGIWGFNYDQSIT